MKLYHKILSAVTAITVLTNFAGCSGGTSSADVDEQSEQSVTSAINSDNKTDTSSEPVENDDKTDSNSITITTPDVDSETSNDTPDAAATTELTEEADDTIIYDPMPIQTLSPADASKSVVTDTLPTNADLIERAGANAFNADSFVMNAKIIGKFSHDENATNEYTFVVTRDTTYLYATYDNADDDIPMQTYEEFRTIVYDETRDLVSVPEMDGRPAREYVWSRVPTIVRHGDSWIECIPRQENFIYENAYRENLNLYQGRDDLAKTATNRIGVLGFIDPSYEYAETDTINTAPIARNENGDITMTFPTWNEWITSDRSIESHLFDNILICPSHAGNTEWKDPISNKEFYDTDGGAVYTFDNDYNLKSVEIDIKSGSKYDLHVSIEFSNWNNVAPIEVPEYVAAEITFDEIGNYIMKYPEI